MFTIRIVSGCEPPLFKFRIEVMVREVSWELEMRSPHGKEFAMRRFRQTRNRLAFAIKTMGQAGKFSL